MPHFEKHHIVPFTPEQMFSIVADVKSYPQFVPHCTALTVLSRDTTEDGAELLIARMTVRYKIFEERYTSRICLNRKTLSVDVEQIEGPFQQLINTWRFERAEKGTKIHFRLSYELRSRALNLIMGKAFQHMFKHFEEAFERRAASVYS